MARGFMYVQKDTQSADKSKKLAHKGLHGLRAWVSWSGNCGSGKVISLQDSTGSRNTNSEKYHLIPLAGKSVYDNKRSRDRHQPSDGLVRIRRPAPLLHESEVKARRSTSFQG